MQTVYVVAVPWDSYTVDNVKVFEKREDATEYAKIMSDARGIDVRVTRCYVE
jgi:hypothetical protein